MEKEKQSLFISFCANSRLDDAIKFLINNPDVCVANGEDSAFATACYYGHLTIAKWLFARYSNFIDISISNDIIFRWTCKAKQLHVLKWLIRIKPDIYVSADNNRAYVEAWCWNNIIIAKWLTHFNPIYTPYNIRIYRDIDGINNVVVLFDLV